MKYDRRCCSGEARGEGWSAYVFVLIQTHTHTYQGLVGSPLRYFYPNARLFILPHFWPGRKNKVLKLLFSDRLAAAAAAWRARRGPLANPPMSE